MKKKLKVPAYLSMAIAVPYLANSFILLNFNFATWSKGDRFIVVILAMIIAAIIGYMRGPDNK